MSNQPTNLNEEEQRNMNIPTSPTADISELKRRAKDPSFWREQWHNARLVWRLLRDPAVPIYLKCIPFAAVAYLVLPADLVPDLLLGLGQLDDVAILLGASKAFVSMSPQAVVAQHRLAIQQEDGFYLEDHALDESIVINGDK